MLHSTSHKTSFSLKSILTDAKISDLNDMNVKEAMMSICGGKIVNDESLTYENCDILRSSPSICKYIIGNPKAFLSPENAQMSAKYGFKLDDLNQDVSATSLAKLLPVIYIADSHSEYGTLGLQLNSKETETTMMDIHPELKHLRSRPIYRGGAGKSGASFMMVHRKSGFPENRIWKGLPEDDEFKLYFSPDIAMANELCDTNDAKPNEFKFFTWTTVWLPKQLELEYSKRLWLTVQAPVDVIFDEDISSVPLWTRIVSSLPPGRIFPTSA